VKSVICKYCAEIFTPLPGKPGYINECPECLNQKMAPLLRAPLGAASFKQRKLLDPVKARENGIKALMKYYAALGKPITKEKARKWYDKLMADDDARADTKVAPSTQI